MINLELPKKLKASANQAHQVAAQIFRPISRKYDLAEHEYPVELDTMAAMVEGLSDSGGDIGGASGGRSDASAKGAQRQRRQHVRALNSLETCWGDVGLMLSIPYQGLGNSAIAAVVHRRTARAFRQGVGLDGHHRTQLRLRLRRSDHHRRSRRRRVGSQRREDLRHRR